MALSNKERQALHRARLRAQAGAAAGLTEAMTELLGRYREMIADLDQQVDALESGAIRFLRGGTDATPEALERTRRQRASLQAVVNKHDHQGATG
jgi:hypothetical protein